MAHSEPVLVLVQHGAHLLRVALVLLGNGIHDGVQIQLLLVGAWPGTTMPFGPIVAVAVQPQLQIVDGAIPALGLSIRPHNSLLGGGGIPPRYPSSLTQNGSMSTSLFYGRLVTKLRNLARSSRGRTLCALCRFGLVVRVRSGAPQLRCSHPAMPWLSTGRRRARRGDPDLRQPLRHARAAEGEIFTSGCSTRTASLQDFRFPYAKIARGRMRWYTLALPSPEAPERFYVALSFNPEQTKGIYLGLDKSVKESHSYVGLPEEGFHPITEKYDWMVRVYLAAHKTSSPIPAPREGQRGPR